jgi:hypothetical protein
MIGRSFLLSLIVIGAGCHPPLTIVPSAPRALPPGHPPIAVDTAPKEELRLVPPEAYLRSYLALFGNLSPLEAQKQSRGGDGGQLFDTWGDYLGALGFPDHRLDLPRARETNALMVAAFERLGVALCDRAVERDLRAPPGKARVVFAFDATPAPVDEAGFAPRFDALHRTFLGYPAALAPGDRIARFWKLYQETVARHGAPKAPKSRFSPSEAGWASVCYGLVRHPEFHLY